MAEMRTERSITSGSGICKEVGWIVNHKRGWDNQSHGNIHWSDLVNISVDKTRPPTMLKDFKSRRMMAS